MESPPVSTQSVPADPRQRLVEAAGEVFSEQGFQNATIRDICQRAGANIASVNYYFGGKEKLYEEVLRFVHGKAMRHAPTETLGGGAPEERLRWFIAGFVKGLLSEGVPEWETRLIAREMAEPTAALEMLVEAHIRPRSEALRGIVREMLGPGLSEERIWLCAFSVVGQILFYHNCRPVLVRLNPQLISDPGLQAKLADHIHGFCLAALRQMASESAKGEKP